MDKKILLLPVLFMLLLLSCEKIPVPGDLNENGRPGGSGRDTSTIYVTGIGYPADYDWRKGNYNDVECYLLVFADGKKYLKLPIGDEYHLSPYPDMHRLVNGCLYSDYSTGRETIISKNGQELFRYEGREMMSGFLVRGEDVYTLGTDRDGKGFSFRKNGRLLFSDREAVPVGEMGQCLYEDNGDIGFAFRKKYGPSQSNLGAWYVYHHGEAEIIHQREDISVIHAVRRVDDRLCLVASISDRNSPPILVWGDETYTIDTSLRPNEITVCQIVSKEGAVYLKMKVGRGMMSKQILWSATESDFLYKGLLPVYDFFIEDGQCAFIVLSKLRVGFYLFPSGKHQFLPGHYQIMDPACVSFDEGVLRVALSFFDHTRHPVLWTDGKIREMPFFGHITSVVVEKR